MRQFLNHPTTDLGCETWCDIVQYDSLEEMIEACKKFHAEQSRFTQPTLFENDPRWVGRTVRSITSLERMLKEPWEEGMRMFDKMLAEIDTHSFRPVSMRRRACWSPDEGDEINLDRLRAGQDFWRTSHRESTTGSPLVTIGIGLATPGSKHWTECMWRAVAAVALTKLLEDAGYRVQLLGVWRTSGVYNRREDGGVCTAVELKRESDPLDLVTLVNATSGWCKRTLWHLSSHQRPHVNGGYGMSELIQGLMPMFTNNEAAICSDGSFDRSGSVAWLRTQVENFSKEINNGKR